MTRLALDLDRVSQFNLLKAYFSLATFTNKLELYLSSVDSDGGEHYHLHAYDLPEADDDFIENLRHYLGDDPIRIWLDVRLHKLKPSMVCFNRRVPIETNRPRYRHRIYSIVWLPFWSKLPALKKHRKCRKRSACRKI